MEERNCEKGRGFKQPTVAVQAAILLDLNAEVVQVDASGGDEVTFPVEPVECDAQQGFPSYDVCIIHDTVGHRSGLFADGDARTSMLIMLE